jgi:NitT/TauT family transport system substrate-binding protein
MKATLIAVCLLLACCAKKPDHARVRIAFLGTVVQPQQMPVALAETLGYYKDEGIDVTTVNLPSYSKTLEALIGGSVDVAGIAYAQTIQMAAEGQRVCAFFIGFRRMSTVLAIPPSANGKIRRVEDLKGAVIGIPSPGPRLTSG